MLSSFFEQAARRGLFTDDFQQSPATAFALVRDMPYQRASSRAPDAIVQEWRGTCSGKHYLLKSLFEEMRLRSKVIMCTHRFTLENTGHFPIQLREVLEHGPVPDIHTFIKLKTNNGWMDVDATWPSQAGALGMPVNHEFREGVSMGLACEPIEMLEVPGGEEPQPFKERLIKSFCGDEARRRDRFIAGLSDWLAENTQRLTAG